MPRFKVKDIADICKGNLKGTGEFYVDNFAIDSRRVNESSLFVPIVGENVDAHRFIEDVYNSGCRVCFCSDKSLKPVEGMSYIEVDNTVEALQSLAEFYRESIKVPVVAVTGSVGKTSSREVIAKALSAKYKVYQTKGNGNSQIGVPLTILEFEEDCEIAVIEMGISMPGEMTRIAKVVKPDVAVITNIGDAHIEYLGSRKGVMEEKLHITDYMKKGSKLVLNADDDLLATVKLSCDIEKLEVFTSPKEGAVFFVSDKTLEEGLASFTADLDGEKVFCKLGAYGNHQINNAMLALTVAKIYNVNLLLAAKKIAEFRGFKHRQELLQKESIEVLDDSYNASPSSMKAALDILENIGGERVKVAVLADMKELGKDERTLHEDIGAYVADIKSISCLYTLGELAKSISSEAERKRKDLEVCHFDSREELLKALKTNFTKDCVILFKGSNSMRLFDVIDEYLA